MPIEMPSSRQNLTQDGELFPSIKWYDFWSRLRFSASAVGETRMSYVPGEPEGWLLADGRAVSRTEYPALFAAIGIIYGAGDGSTTFNLPTAPAGDPGPYTFIVAA